MLFVHGDRDSIVKPSVAPLAQGLVTGSRLRWVEGEGHFMVVGHPELLLDDVTLVEFIDPADEADGPDDVVEKATAIAATKFPDDTRRRRRS
jgi:hypothetical protein